MPAPKTNTIKDAQGVAFDAATVSQGLVKVWSEGDIVAQINGPVSAQPVTDAQTGKIVRFEYYADQFGSVVDRKTLVAADAAGTAIAGDPITLTKITVDLDDERSTKPIYLDNWDAKKLEVAATLQTEKQGQASILSTSERADRYFEALRKATKAADAAALGDGVTRVVDITALVDPKDVYIKFQDAIAELVKQKNSRRKGTNRAFIFVAVPPKVLTVLKRAVGFIGSDRGSAILESGSTFNIDGVSVYENITSDISFVGIRGAAVVPIANPEFVQYPSKSNAGKFAWEWVLPKAGSEGILYGDGLIALGDPAVIKA